MNFNNTNKYTKLFLGLIFDALGYVSFIIPGIGEFADIVWAPASAWLMTKLYKGRTGRIAAVFSFIEEALPGLDIIPSFTLMWLYTYVYSNKSDKNTVTTL
ncbi:MULTISPECIES: hypothetical protein [unclassified Olleya]|jgi:hypothetical protein|uniref:hypothetical protein n=1 Tax=unclassified Olleya TaxID=2615019 RepID=UPI0011A7CD24|nr:hypothetical protein [Olleya sp. Hel_I_94]TVZ46387.1 hypothetical protein JM82_0959 [Olleya sp. Hel_I_94]|tara:strand:+ start:36550 stop:36852 length:303 start_codon:yes stop_codon:yes gene_type:complete